MTQSIFLLKIESSVSALLHMIGHMAVSTKQAIHSLTSLHSEDYIDNLITSGHSSLDHLLEIVQAI